MAIKLYLPVWQVQRKCFGKEVAGFDDYTAPLEMEKMRLTFISLVILSSMLDLSEEATVERLLLFKVQLKLQSRHHH